METGGFDTSRGRGPLQRRLRTALFGYRRSDVAAALERSHDQLARMASSLERSWTTRQELTAELARLREALEAERGRAMSIELAGRARAARIVAEAEEQARCLHEASTGRFRDANARVQQLLRAREQLLGELTGILQTHAQLLERVERERRGGVAATGRIAASA